MAPCAGIFWIMFSLCSSRHMPVQLKAVGDLNWHEPFQSENMRWKCYNFAIIAAPLSTPCNLDSLLKHFTLAALLIPHYLQFYAMRKRLNNSSGMFWCQSTCCISNEFIARVYVIMSCFSKDGNSNGGCGLESQVSLSFCCPLGWLLIDSQSPEVSLQQIIYSVYVLLSQSARISTCCALCGRVWCH